MERGGRSRPDCAKSSAGAKRPGRSHDPAGTTSPRYLSTPLGSAVCAQAALQSKRQEHDAHWTKISGMRELQKAWLLFSFLEPHAPTTCCGYTRLKPCWILLACRKHDAAAARCLADVFTDDEPLALDTLASGAGTLAAGSLGRWPIRC